MEKMFFCLAGFHGLHPAWVCLLIADFFFVVLYDLSHSCCCFSVSLSVSLLNRTFFPPFCPLLMSKLLLFAASLCLWSVPQPRQPRTFPELELSMLWEHQCQLQCGSQGDGESHWDPPWPRGAPLGFFCIHSSDYCPKRFLFLDSCSCHCSLLSLFFGNPLSL